MPQFGKFVDSRDGHVYRTVLMPDGKWWSSENLAWDGAGLFYNNDPALGAVYGRLYSFAELASAVPAGCHVPTETEWGALIAATGNTVAGKRLKSNSALWSTNTGTDDYGFHVLPGGYQSWAGGIAFRGINSQAWFWSSTDSGDSCLDKAFTATTDTVASYLSPKASRDSVRFIVDSGNIPDGPKLFGAPFQGFERGYSLEISRKISESFARGSAPVLWPYAPADKDEWIVDAELWVTAAQAAEIQARVPPKGSPLERAIRVPPRSGANTFAGLAPANAGDSADTYLDPVVLSLESLGQKAVAMDLYGFRIRFSLSCSSISNPYSSNPATPPTATPPAWLNQKFRVHQIEDCSTEERVIAPSGKWAASPNPIKAGRGLPLSITLDYLTQERADELVAFFRGIRSNTFTAPLDFPGATSTSFVARKLSLSRPGLHWEGTLEVYQA